MTQELINIHKDFYLVLVVLIHLNRLDLDSVSACINKLIAAESLKGELEPSSNTWTAEEIRQTLSSSNDEERGRWFEFMSFEVPGEKREAIERIYLDGLEEKNT